MSQDIDFGAWNKATGDLDWGSQHVIHEALQVAAEGKSSIVYSADYADGGACLVNTVAPMLEVGGGNGIPSKYFGAMVREFDRLNAEFARRGINTEFRRMSPFAAEILLRNFGALKPQPKTTEKVVQKPTGQAEIIPEVSDEDLAASWLKAISQPAINEQDAAPIVKQPEDAGFAYNDLD